MVYLDWSTWIGPELNMNFYPKFKDNGISHPKGIEWSTERMCTQPCNKGLQSFSYLAMRNKLKSQTGPRLLIYNLFFPISLSYSSSYMEN